MAATVVEAVGHEVDPVHVPLEDDRATAGDDPTADARASGVDPRSFRAWFAAESPFAAPAAA